MRATVTPFTGTHGVIISPERRGEDILSLDAEEVASTFASSSVVLFRDFAVQTVAFKAFSERLCADFMTYEGGASARKTIGGDATVMTVSEPSHMFAIPLHGEMYYAKQRPGILWFYCVRPAATAGETTVADGAAIYESLSRGARALLEESPIRYLCTHANGRWQGAFGTDDLADVRRYCEANELTFRWNEADRSITTDYVSTAISESRYGNRRVFINNILTMTRWESQGHRRRIVRLKDGSPIPPHVLSELQELEDAMTVLVAWRPGDVLMLDNTRYLHGRRAFTDASREIYVRLSGDLRFGA